MNGKLYPLAKVQLGRMGALHPANRLAAYLTGRVGSNRKPQGSSSTCKPAETQNPGLVSAAPVTPDLSDPTTTKPTRPVTVVTLSTSATGETVIQVCLCQLVGAPEPRPHPQHLSDPLHLCSDSQVRRSVAPEGSQLLLQAPPPHPGAPPPTPGQKLVLQLVQRSSGIQSYRRVDGKLVQLIPISHLRPAGGTPVTGESQLSINSS